MIDSLSNDTQNTANDAVASNTATTDNTSAPQPQPVQSGAPSVTVQPSPVRNPSQQTGQSATVTNRPVNPVSQHPAIERASLLRDVAQTLAGGPRYTTSVDSNTGTTTRTRVPLSKSDIALAIVAEALSGSLSGLSQRGPGAVGRAAEAGFQQVSEQRQQADAQQEATAQQALARKAQTYELNLRMRQLALTVGRMNQESNQDYISQFSNLVDTLQNQYPQAIKGVATYADLPKYDVTADSAIPYKVVPRLDPQSGKQVVNQDGEPQWDLNYLVIDPAFKADDLLTGEDKKDLAEMRAPGFSDSNGNPSTIPNFPLRLNMVLNFKAKAATFELSKQNVAGFYATLGQSDKAPSLPSLVAKDPTLVSALEKFQPFLNATGGNYEHAISELGAKDAQAAGKILGLYGGTNAIRQYDSLNQPVKDVNQAEAILADSSSPEPLKKRARSFIALDQRTKAGTAGAEARARKAVEGDGTGTATPDVHQAADAIASGRGTFEQLTQGMGKEAAAFRRAVESDLLKRYPNVNVAALKAYSKAADSQAVQSQITNARSLFGANGQPGSFDSLEDAIRAVPKARFPILSEFGQKTAYQLGSPEMATLKAIKTDIASDLAKFNAGGGNHSSDHQVELYREQLNEAQTPEQVEAVLKDLRAISSKRLAGIVGTNPYLANMTADINDPVTKQARGNGGTQVPQSRKPIPPQGATMQVPGSDGKMHWSDGKRDLGVVQ